MKTKQSKNILVHELNKETIAHLNRSGMVRIKTGEGRIGQAVGQFIAVDIDPDIPTDHDTVLCTSGTDLTGGGIPPVG